MTWRPRPASRVGLVVFALGGLAFGASLISPGGGSSSAGRWVLMRYEQRSAEREAAVDVNGEELGIVDAVYLDKGSGEPEWVAVRTGRSETSLAPLVGATVTDAGVQLAVVAKLVRNAPHSDHPPGQITPELTDAQEAELYLYYSVDYTSPSAETEVTEGEPSGAEAVGPEGPALGTS